MENKPRPAIGVEQRYVDVRGAEKYTSLSRWTLARFRERGELPAIRIGAAVRFSVDDLDDFMRARRAQ